MSIGTNQGDRHGNLERSLENLQAINGIEVINVSGIYETEPWGVKEQELFLNQVVEIDTNLDPLSLLRSCQDIEKRMGRERLTHWGPRIIDIDILLYEDLIIETAELTIPHPYMEEREFVLAPLNDIAPELILPSGRAVKNLKGEGKVKKILF